MAESPRPALPQKHPARINLDARVNRGASPASLTNRFIQRDDRGAFRIITVNGLGEILNVSDPMDGTRIVTERLKKKGMTPVQDYWDEYDSIIRRKRFLLFGRTWDGVNWWEVGEGVDAPTES